MFTPSLTVSTNSFSWRLLLTDVVHTATSDEPQHSTHGPTDSFILLHTVTSFLLEMGFYGS